MLRVALIKNIVHLNKGVLSENAIRTIIKLVVESRLQCIALLDPCHIC